MTMAIWEENTDRATAGLPLGRIFVSCLISSFTWPLGGLLIMMNLITINKHLSLCKICSSPVQIWEYTEKNMSSNNLPPILWQILNNNPGW